MTSLRERIAAVLGNYDLLQHPFYTAWSRGELTAAQLALYGGQYVHHVAAFPAYLTALHSRLPEGSMRRAVLANAAEEEIDGRAHADLWRDFTAGMAARASADHGGNAAQHAPAAPEITALVQTFRTLAAEAAPVEALAAFYAYESQVPRIAAEKRRGLEAHYGADAATVEYFRLHETADVAHSGTWLRLLDREQAAADSASPEQGAECSEAILRGAEKAARALWTALDGIERERLAIAGPHQDR